MEETGGFNPILPELFSAQYIFSFRSIEVEFKLDKRELKH